MNQKIKNHTKINKIMDIDLENLTDDDVVNDFKNLYVNNHTGLQHHIIENKLVNSFKLWINQKHMSLVNIINQCVTSDLLLNNLIELCQEIKFETLHIVKWVEAVDTAEFLVKINYDFNYLFEIEDLDVLKYLINHGLNFDPTLTVDGKNYLSYTEEFEVFEYLHQNFNLRLTDNLLFTSEFIEYLLEHGMNPNILNDINEYFLAKYFNTNYTPKLIELLIHNQYHTLDQDLLQLLYYNLIYMSDDYGINDMDEYINLVYEKIESFEVDDFNLEYKSDLFRLDIYEILSDAFYLNQILAKLKPSSKGINLQYFDSYETLKVVLDHFGDLYTIEELNAKYCRLFKRLETFILKDQDYYLNIIKPLKLLTSYGAKPKIEYMYDEFIIIISSCGVHMDLVKSIINDVEFRD